MSARTEKVASIVQQVTAKELTKLAPDLAVRTTITSVDVSPDMKHALLWVGILGTVEEAKKSLERLDGLRGELQRAVAGAMTTKFSPRLAFRHDSSGEYAQHMAEIMNKL